MFGNSAKKSKNNSKEGLLVQAASQNSDQQNKNENQKRDFSLSKSISELFGHKKRNQGNSFFLDKKTRTRITQMVSGRVLFDEPLSKYSTLRIGGPADCMVFVQTIEDLKAVLQFADAEKVPVFILGGGSNLLIRDGGIRGFTLCLREGFQEVQPISEPIVADDTLAPEQKDQARYFRVQSGASTPRLVRAMANQGLGGLEGLSGVLGTVGGAVMGNAGTRHGEIAEAIVSMTAINRHGTVKTFKRQDLKFSYRNLDMDKSWIMVEAEIRLLQKTKEEIMEKVKSILDYRHKTQPLNLPNCGSVFKNPPKTKSSESAGELIERSGLKGVRLRGAQVSELHGNWIVNLGDATAHDVIELITLIKDKVNEKTGIELETEIKMIGDRVKA